MTEMHLKSISRSINAMGTQLELLLLHHDKMHLQFVVNDIKDELIRIESRLSRFKAASEVSRINRFAGEKALLLDPEMISIIKAALDFHKLTGGAFDITVAPFLEKWGFYQKQYAVADENALIDLRKRVGAHLIQLDEAARTIRFTVPGMEIDLGGMGKGYALDRILEIVRENDIASGFISFGGSSIYGLNVPEGRPGWQFSYKVSSRPELEPVPVVLRNQAFSLSASYNRRFSRNGKFYGHIFDPNSGAPAEELLAAAVLHPAALTAEILSTAFMVMGWEKSQLFLSQHLEICAHLVLPYLDEYQLYEFNFERL
ncbi:FAD:protein FMN transferase [candidate division KSB1 bacterium]|nr:FAD:protein FMN transferase [candidate division KSB1 bacterium]